MSGSLLIVGFGNPLMGDDGAGIAVTERLLRLPMPAGVRVETCHSDATSIGSLWRGETEVWVVDALWSDAEPGTLYRVPSDVLATIAQPQTTAHRLSLPECIRWLRLTYTHMKAVRFRLWGIVAAQVDAGVGLSKEVEAGASVAAQTLQEAAADFCVNLSPPSDDEDGSKVNDR